MAVTFLTAQTELRASIGNPIDGGSAAAANLKTCLNDALLEIYDKFRHLRGEVAQTITTVDGTATYALGSTVEAVLFVWDATAGMTGRRLRKMPEDMLPTTVPEVTGRPTHYYRTENSILLYPTPDDVYTLKALCRVRPTALSADADPLPLPDTWKPAWLRLARHYYYDSFGNDPAKAREAYASYQAFVNDKPTTAEEESVEPTIGVDIGYATRSTFQRRSWDNED